jgi:hypothetical protein
MQHSDHLLRQQNLIRDSFLTVAPVQKDQVLPQQIPKGQMIDSIHTARPLLQNKNVLVDSMRAQPVPFIPMAKQV